MYGKAYYHWCRARELVKIAYEDDPHIVQEIRRQVQIQRIPDPTCSPEGRHGTDL